MTAQPFATWKEYLNHHHAPRLEELRTALRSESMSYGELAELQSLAEFIDEGDVELLEAAGVPESASDPRPDPRTHTEYWTE